MRFLFIVLQWFSIKKPNPEEKETKKAVLQLLLIDNLIVIVVAFWLGVQFALTNPAIAQEFVDIFAFLDNIFK